MIGADDRAAFGFPLIDQLRTAMPADIVKGFDDGFITFSQQDGLPGHLHG